MYASARHGHPCCRGFTLIELLIVMTVLAIITAIAVPSYREYVLRSNRGEAMSALHKLSNLQEDYYSNQLAYTSSLSVLSYPATTPNDLYKLSISTNPTVGYTLQAVAINQQLQDTKCKTFTLDGLGEKTAEDASSNDTTADCWSR